MERCLLGIAGPGRKRSKRVVHLRLFFTRKQPLDGGRGFFAKCLPPKRLVERDRRAAVTAIDGMFDAADASRREHDYGVCVCHQEMSVNAPVENAPSWKNESRCVV